MSPILESKDSISIRRIDDINDPKIDSAIKCLCLAFASSELANSYVDYNADLFPVFFRATINCTILGGSSYFAENTGIGENGEVVGVIGWFGPGQSSKSVKERAESGWPEFMRRAAEGRGGDWYTNTIVPTITALYTRIFPSVTATVEGYNVWVLGAAPTHQGKGIGTKLLRICLDQAGQEPSVEGALVCLETEAPQAIAMYVKSGMKAVASTPVEALSGTTIDITVMLWRR